MKKAFKLPKNRRIQMFCVAFLTVFLFSFVSCKAEATFQAQKDGSVQISFSGACGKYIENMMRSFSGGNANTPLFDAAELQKSFISDGFKNVDVKIPSNVGLSAKMTAPETTFLFSSGLLVCDKKNVYINLSPKVLKNFYSVADEQTITILDLFIAPVFNDETMSEEEYLEIIGSFYGSDAATEISECNLKLTLISVDGKKKTVDLPLVKLLTLQETIVY